MERDEYARLRLSLKKIKEEVSHIEQTIENIKIRKITEGLTYAEWAASHDNQPSVEDTLERIGTNHDVQSDKSIQEALVEEEEEHFQKFDKLTYEQAKEIGIKFTGTYENTPSSVSYTHLRAHET